MISNRVLYIIGAICAALAAADFFHDRHGDFFIENLPFVWCAFGFAAYIVIIFAAKVLRRLTLRPEDYYRREAIDAEETEAGDV